MAETLAEMTYDRIGTNESSDHPEVLVDDIKNSIDNAIAMANQIEADQSDELDIPTFLRNEIKDMEL